MIKKSEIQKYRNNYLKDKSKKSNQYDYYNSSLIDLIPKQELDENEEFDLDLDIGSQYNQKHTGYCWCYASARILNTFISKKLGDSKFEVSIKYLSFYDKLERFNILTNRFKYSKDCYEKNTYEVLLNGIGDGGYFTWFANLVDKYGIVPKECFPDSYHSNNSTEIDIILSRLLRKFYLEVNLDNFEVIQKKYLDKVYTVLSLLYGLPPELISYNYIDDSGKRKKILNISPLDFYKKYSDVNLLNDYIEIISYQDSNYKYNNYYEVAGLSNIEEYSNVKYLNLPLVRQKELIVKQLKNNEPVCFYCYITKKQISGLFTDIYKKYSELLDVDLNISRNDIVLTNEIKNGHAMVISGFKSINGVPVKWKIINSRQEKDKSVKYYVADNSWLDKYVSCIIINKKYLNKKELNILSKKPILISYWDNKFK